MQWKNIPASVQPALTCEFGARQTYETFLLLGTRPWKAQKYCRASPSPVRHFLVLTYISMNLNFATGQGKLAFLSWLPLKSASSPLKPKWDSHYRKLPPGLICRLKHNPSTKNLEIGSWRQEQLAKARICSSACPSGTASRKLPWNAAIPH